MRKENASTQFQSMKNRAGRTKQKRSYPQKRRLHPAETPKKDHRKQNKPNKLMCHIVSLEICMLFIIVE